MSVDRIGPWLAAVADEPFAYLTTTGRVTGLPHEIEIWFAARERTVWMLAGGRHAADWVRNLRRDPAVTVRIGDRTIPATARVVTPGTDEETQARWSVWRKYRSGTDDLTSWRDTALPIAADLGGG